MPVHDSFFHPIFLGRRAALDTPPFDAFPPAGRKPWTAPASPRLDLDFHVRHYRVKLAVDLERKELRGRATITVEALRDGLRDVVLDATEMRFESVRSGRRSLPHSSDRDTLRLTLPRPLHAGSRATFEVAYTTSPRKGFVFVGPSRIVSSPGGPRDKRTTRTGGSLASRARRAAPPLR